MFVTFTLLFLKVKRTEWSAGRKMDFDMK